MAVKTDCFAYDEEHKTCDALKELYCKKEQCKFYKSRFVINKKKIEADIKKYAMKR